MALEGKYVLAESHNFVDFLVKTGVPADKAEKANAAKTTVTLTRSGDTISVNHVGAGISDGTINYVLNKEVDEVIDGRPLKSLTTLDGNVLKITAKSADGTSGTRTYTFSDSGFVVEFLAPNGAQAKRVYKRA